MDVDRQLDRLLRQAREDPEVLAVILFGSRARGDVDAASDVDVCIVLEPADRDRLAAARKRLDYASIADLDVQVFESLPLPIRSRVLREGKVLFVRDEAALYALAARTARAYEAFKPYYRTYLAEVARGGS